MFFKQKKSSEVTLIVDIGSSSVGVALVSVSDNIVPKILFSNRLPIALQSGSERSRSLTATTATLESAMNKVSANHAAVQRTRIIFSSPWYASQTKILKVERDSPMLVTHHVVEQLIKEAENRLAGESKSTGETIERRVIQTKLNGYDTPSPYNKKAKSVEVVFFASTVEKDILDSVRRIVGKHFHIQNNEISSFPLAAFSVISSLLPTEKDFLVVDVRGEVTDLSLVNAGALLKTLSFPQGKNALAQALIGSSGQSPTAVLSLINVAIHGGGSAAQSEVLKKTEIYRQTWSQAYVKATKDLLGTSILPSTVLLMADQDIEMFFENVLNEIKKDGNLRLLKHLNLRGFVDASSVPTDPFLALESIFVTMM